MMSWRFKKAVDDFALFLEIQKASDKSYELFVALVLAPKNPSDANGDKDSRRLLISLEDAGPFFDFVIIKDVD